MLYELVNPEIVATDKVEQDLDRGHYGIPVLASKLEPYLKFVKGLPLFDGEHIFGFEENIERDRMRHYGINLFASISRLKTLDSTEDNPLDITIRDANDNIVLEKAHQLLSYVPEPIEYEEIQRRFTIDKHNPLTNLGNKETEKYSILLKIIRNTLDDVIRQQGVNSICFITM